MTVGPNSELALNDTFTVRLTVSSRDPRSVKDVTAGFSVGTGVRVRVRRAPGGTVQVTCPHEPPLGGHSCTEMGVEWRALAFRTGQVRVLLAELQIVDFACPSGGDFINPVYAGISGPIKRGHNGGMHRVWFENDPADYLARRPSQGTSNTGPPHRGCHSTSIDE